MSFRKQVNEEVNLFVVNISTSNKYIVISIGRSNKIFIQRTL